MIGIALQGVLRLCLVGNGKAAEEVDGETGVIGADFLALILVPLVGRLVLIEYRLGVGAMAKDGGDGDENSEYAHGESDRPQLGFLTVFSVFFQFLNLIGFHGGVMSSVTNEAGQCHLRFQLAPSFESSMMMPFSFRSLRI